jgi:hypothetical protein
MKTQLFTLLLLLGIFVTPFSWGNDRFFDQQKPDESEAISVYPNPVNEKAFIELQLDANTFAKIEFYDLTGKKVKEFKEVFLNDGKNKIEFKANDFRDGYFFVKVTTDQWVKTKRFLVRR